MRMDQATVSRTVMVVHRPLSSGSLGALAWLTILVIVYGSLIPFEYRSATFDQAVDRILNLHLGESAVGNRADLVANLLIYIPLGFLACGAFSRRTLAGSIVWTVLLGVILSVGVEFAQIWASPRTVSLNDILAELAGLGIGLLLWLAAGPRIVQLTQVALHGSHAALRAGLLLYLGAYLFLELSPFDFFISMDELKGRLLSSDPIVLVSGHYGVGLRAGAAMLGKVISAAPIGALIYLHTTNWKTLSWAGLTLGFGVEMVQFFEYSGEADAVSVLLRFLGCAVGFAAVPKLISVKKKPVLLTTLAWIAVPIYVLFLNSLLHPEVVPTGDHGEIIRQVNWLPFYYFYFSSDQNALSSFANYLKIYTPLGALLWLIFDGGHKTAVWAALGTALIQAGLEGAGFWLYFQRPDITNVLIAALGGGVGFSICMWLKRSLADRPTAASESPAARQYHSFAKPYAYEKNEGTSPTAIVSAGIAALIAYCSFYPFNFAASAFTPERLERLVDLTERQFSRGDILGNVLLFVPFGFVEIAALKKSITSPTSRFLTMLAVSLALAIATQVPQLFLPRRDAFSWDIVFNLVGAALGGGLGLRLGYLITRLKTGPLMSPGLVFSLLWAGALLAPLMPSVDLSRFKTSASELFFPGMFSSGQAITLVTGWLVLAELSRGRMHRYVAVAGLVLALSPLFGVRLNWTFVFAPVVALAISGAGAIMPRTTRTIGLMILMTLSVIVDHLDPSFYGQVSRLPWLNDLLRAVFFIAALIYFATRLSLRLRVGAGLAFGLIFLLSAVALSLNNDVWIGFDLFVLLLGLLTAALAKRYRSQETGAQP